MLWLWADNACWSQLPSRHEEGRHCTLASTKLSPMASTETVGNIQYHITPNGWVMYKTHNTPLNLLASCCLQMVCHFGSPQVSHCGQSICYLAVTNLPPTMRMHKDNLLLIGIWGSQRWINYCREITPFCSVTCCKALALNMKQFDGYNGCFTCLRHGV